jgi:IclR family transcriptional regulator, KDG regulon repressor
MLRKTMEVLSLFTPARRELGVLEAAQLMQRPKSTVSRWLSAMEDAGFLDRDPATSRYRVAMRLAAVGELAKQSTSVQREALRHLRDLTEATGETSNLVVLSGSAAVNVEMVESPRPVKHVGWLGRVLPLHATAAGKALMAWGPEEVVDEYLKPPLQRFTEATILDLDEYREELDRSRTSGFAVAWGEMEPDLVGVAAPVRDHAGRVVGALTISAPLSRTPLRELPHLGRSVKHAADSLSASLGYSGSS